MTDSTAVARLAASWLLTYPDEALLARLDDIHAAVETLPRGSRVPLLTFLAHVADTPLLELQQHYVAIFDMRRRACPYLTYWTDGETRNRGMALVRFKEAYAEAGFTIADTELPDHLAVVLEFAAVGDRLTADALLAEHRGAIALLQQALAKMESAYQHVLDAVMATLPALTAEVVERMHQLAASGPPVEQVGLEPFPTAPTLIEIGARR
ncbi:MAG: nitrate reductase molybdenum cofactor assembly chaperone [Actinobacteria bacterium]|nr:nitrate reductase molybdenum cofactor assembly chaperone [Actinomycetota bacterium]MCB9411785.1 nitrate reductase molybdenum cofactor assembly chaperone [Actinomycetota bacterium]